MRLLGLLGTGLLDIPRNRRKQDEAGFSEGHLWNKLPSHLQCAESISYCKFRIRNVLFSLAFPPKKSSFSKLLQHLPMYVGATVVIHH